MSLHEAERPIFKAVEALFKLGTVDFGVPGRRHSTFAAEVGDVLLIRQELDTFKQHHLLFLLQLLVLPQLSLARFGSAQYGLTKKGRAELSHS